MKKEDLVKMYDKTSNLCKEYPKTTLASVALIACVATACIIKMFRGDSEQSKPSNLNNDSNTGCAI